MNAMRLFRTDDPAHWTTEELLPWYLNGTLAADEGQRIEAHLAQCLRCRRELESQRELQAVLAVDDPERAVERALERAHARIDELESKWRPGAIGARLRRGWREARPWLRGALVAQLALVVALAVALIGERRAPEFYRTLGAASAPLGAVGSRLSIVLDPAASEDELRGVLAEIGARIVEPGPGEHTGEHRDKRTVEVAPGREEEALRKLRASAVIRFADRASGAPDGAR